MTVADILAGAHRATTELRVRHAIDPLEGPRGACLVLDQATPIGDQLRADWPTVGPALIEAETARRTAVVTAEVASEPLPPVDAVAELDPPTVAIDMGALLADDEPDHLCGDDCEPGCPRGVVDDEDPLPAMSPELAHFLATGEIPVIGETTPADEVVA